MVELKRCGHVCSGARHGTSRKNCNLVAHAAPARATPTVRRRLDSQPALHRQPQTHRAPGRQTGSDGGSKFGGLGLARHLSGQQGHPDRLHRRRQARQLNASASRTAQIATRGSAARCHAVLGGGDVHHARHVMGSRIMAGSSSHLRAHACVRRQRRAGGARPLKRCMRPRAAQTQLADHEHTHEPGGETHGANHTGAHGRVHAPTGRCTGKCAGGCMAQVLRRGRQPGILHVLK